MSEVRCEACRFWAWNRDVGGHQIGRCHFGPPRQTLNTSSWDFETSASHDWCGQWKPGTREDIFREQLPHYIVTTNPAEDS